MKRVLLTAAIFPIAALLGLNCSSDDPIVPRAPTGGAAGTTAGGAGGAGGTAGGTTTTTGAGGTTAGTDTTTTTTTGTGTGGAAGLGAGGAGTAGDGTGATTGTGTGGTAGAGAGGTASAGAGGTAGTTAIPDAGVATDSSTARSDASEAGGPQASRDATVDRGVTTTAETGPATAGPLCMGDCRTVVGGLDGHLTPSACAAANDTGYDCQLAACTGGQKTFTGAYTLTGPALDATRSFDVTFTVRGIVECKTIQGGMRATTNQGATQLASGNDMFHIGGTLPTTDYNTHELHITPVQPAPAVNDYYLNSCPAGFGENHYTWVLNYTKTIRVRGGSTINYRGYDRNCRQITNCGLGNAQSPCSNQWALPTAELAALTPPVVLTPATINFAASPGAKGQFLAIDVTQVTAVP